MTSTARSSGYNDRSGAKEHTLESVWRGALAYSNIGLPGAGFSGPHWDKKHKPVLLELFTKLLSSEEPVLGLLLCEVGNMDDLLDAEGKKRLERVITDAFRAAGATEHGEPQFIWSRDETMAAFRAEVQVRALDPLQKMETDDSEDELTVDVEKASLTDGEDSDSESIERTRSEENVDLGEASERSEASGAEEHADEIKATGFALMKSAALLPVAFLNAKNCIDCAPLHTMHGACTREDMTALQECVNQFFSRRAVLQSTPPRQDAKAARVLKPSNEIAHAWQVIMGRRRLEEPNDRCKIKEPDTLKHMYNTWMHEWLEKNLTTVQRQKPESKKTSIFHAYLHSNFGGKHFVMALWQTGIQWAPTPEKLRDDRNGALEHVAKNFAKWTQRVARAITRHKSGPDAEEARRRSGQS